MKYFAFSFGLYSAICGLVWIGFVRVEALLLPDARIRIASWIKATNLSEVPPKWAEYFTEIFDAVFTKKHISWKCFSRSCLASIGTVSLLSFVYLLIFEWYRFPLGHIITGAVTIGLLGSILNLLPDYISLLETRYILKRISMGCPNQIKQLAWLVIDAIFTIVIIMVAVYVGVPLLGAIIREIPSHTISEVNDIVRSGFLSLIGSYDENAPLGVFIYSTFFTSAWIWLYILGSTLTRILYPIDRLRFVITRYFDIESSPMQVMAAVFVAVFTPIYWVGMVWLWFNRSAGIS